MQATKGHLQYDNGRVLRGEQDITDGLQKIYKTPQLFNKFLEDFFGKEVREHFISLKQSNH